MVLSRFNFRVEIYYQTLNVHSITQSAKYTVRFKNILFSIAQHFLYLTILQSQGIIGALGGALSLYLGKDLVSENL